MIMHNFPTHFWRRFQEHKDRTAVATVDEKGKVVEETFWQWTRRVQRLAIALLEAGFEPGARIAMTPAGGRDWLDLAFASWLVGGCLVVVPANRPRVQTLRALARTGAEWVVVRDPQQYRFLRGPSGNLPPGLRWIAFEKSEQAPSGANFSFLDDLDQHGRSLAVRGWVDKLARAIYDVKPDQPTLILFDPELGEDPHGAFFSGEKVGAMLDFIGEDLQLKDDACVISALDYGNFPSWLLTAATLLQGKKVATANSLDEASSNLHNLNATHLICGPTFLERRAMRLRADLEETNPALQSDGAGSSTFGLAAMLSQVGKEAARKLFFDPLAREFGGRLKSVYLLGGRLSPEFTDVLDRAEINVLGLFGAPECGISHLERPEAKKRDTVGRPVQSFACKIAGARREQVGEILVRSHILFDGYWDDQGPRTVDPDGWLHTAQTGHIRSGYLFLKD
jgi:long-subunit acyl-CoA synthetase (AMP-forming)